MWGFHKAPNIERVHLNFCKRILQVKRTTQNDFIYGELGRYRMFVCRQIRIIRYWLNIVSGKKAPYVCALYHTQLSIVDNGTESNWVRAVKQLLFQCGFGEAWCNQGVGDTEISINLFKQRVYDIYKQSWESRLRDSSRATFYRAIKDMHMKSNYMGIVNVGCHRSAMIKLITSSHRLAINWNWEMGPPGGTSRPKSMSCVQCSSPEDEYHLILTCPLYGNIRKALIPKCYHNLPSKYKLVLLFNDARKMVIRNLAKFIYKAFILRKTYG